MLEPHHPIQPKIPFYSIQSSWPKPHFVIERRRCDGSKKKKRSEKRIRGHGTTMVRRRCGHNGEMETCEKIN
ncbi:hypothetical protein YC2023_101482 [Brassica napus]